MLEIFNIPHADPLNLPMIQGIGPVSIITGLYLVFILRLGRWFMEKRQPYQLREILKFYNLFQVAYNGMIFLMAVSVIMIYKPYKFSCMAPLPLEHDGKKWERILGYAYYINKYIDFLDTIFFVLRKKYKQITILHITHHAAMPIISYLTLRMIGYGGLPVSFVILNTFVHAVMYSYYYLASQNPNLSKSIGWKKYITRLQIVQFILGLSHIFWTLQQEDCNVSNNMINVFIASGIFLIAMFSNFYIRTYVFSKSK
ncbi:elongation of very long chain fatty acids protein F-like [Drosophila willistoni]|uniref:elongation of very long chain fatty acids protein F-like n=1 Tax=Drosophila willistoni TaxID=7260 RepID=UPI00017D6534|nr:elongation of very long chain fatty acids protein F-like [Drosophila willistoni]